MMKPFLDATIIIKAFTENEDKEDCRKILYEEFVTNTLCLIEAQHGISVIKNDKIFASECIKSIFKRNVSIVPIDKNLLFESFKRIDKYSLNIFDLINYVAALINNCQEFVSYDRHFDGLEIKRVEP